MKLNFFEIKLLKFKYFNESKVLNEGDLVFPGFRNQIAVTTP